MERSKLNGKSSILVKVYKEGCGPGENPPQLRESNETLLKELEAMDQFEDIDVWKPADVVFLDDSPAVLGRVVTVDQHQAIVEVTSHSTSSKPKTALKVFKTSDLELCMTPRLTSDPGPSSPEGVWTSQHIAGVVQHRPVCLLMPDGSSQSSSEEDSTRQRGILHGYRPLAVHASNSGPTLLVESVSSGQAFVICSGQASVGPFTTSSFVAHGNSNDSKPTRSTVPEESVSAREGGFAEDESLIRSVEACKQAMFHQSTGRPQENGALHPYLRPELISCHSNGQVVLLKDIHGHLCPLLDGLRLKPDSSPLLSASYRCVLSHTYSLGNGRKTLLFVLGELCVGVSCSS